MAASPLRTQVLAGYRRLLRARVVAFDGDQLALVKSREAMRAAFESSRQEVNEDKIRELLRGVREADEMLRFNILQGKKNERGNFAVPISEDKAQRMASHEQVTAIDLEEENIPLEEPSIVSTHSKKS